MIPHRIEVMVRKGGVVYSFSFDEWALKAYKGHREQVMLEGIKQCLKQIDGPNETFDFNPNILERQVEEMFETIKQNV